MTTSDDLAAQDGIRVIEIGTKMNRYTFTIVILIGTLAVGLLVSGQRLLVSERVVRPGESLVVEGYGDLGKYSQRSLVCKYFTGSSIKTRVYWFASNNFLGRDQCPFLVQANS